MNKFMKKKLSKKAIAIGLLVDIGGTIMFFILAYFVASIITALSLTAAELSLPREVVVKIVSSTLESSMLLHIIIYTSSYVFIVFGGYITALIAEKEEMKHTFIFGLIALVLTIISFIIFGSIYSYLHIFIILSLIIPCAMLGGYVRVWVKK